MLDQGFWQGRRVLVTGHTGFKGSWLSLWLLRLGAKVSGYSLVPDKFNSLFTDLGLDHSLSCHGLDNIDHYIGDLCDSTSLARCIEQTQPEVIIHLAAQSLVRRGYREPLITWSTNVYGSLNLLESLRHLSHRCSIVMVTTDKVYHNSEWDYGYRENDRLGGHDPYSASKAAAELAISSWRSSFVGCGEFQTPHLLIATARAGNVIGGGDWAEDRIVPDAVRSLSMGKPISIRRPKATRPWQHVLEPLWGYLLLAQKSYQNEVLPSAFNFGPRLEANRSVEELIEAILGHWSGTWQDLSDPTDLHESTRLHLQIDKAHHQLGWKPRWSFDTTVQRTVDWYHLVHEGASAFQCCLNDLDYFDYCYS